MKLPRLFRTTAVRLAVRYALAYIVVLGLALVAFFWTTSRYVDSRLETALAKGARELLVGNPDISAPLGGFFSAEPGYWAVRAMQVTGIKPRWYGKPHAAAFDLVFARLQQVYGRRFERNRVAMVGDTLHTDILGARAAGWSSVLVTDHGLFRGRNVDEFINVSGIVQ